MINKIRSVPCSYLIKVVIATLIIGFVSSIAKSEGDVVVIVSKLSNTPSLDRLQINDIFLGRTDVNPAGVLIIALNQKEGSSARTYFNLNILEKSESQLRAYWSRQVFSGGGTPPKEVETNDYVIKLIESNPNLIGYVDRSSLTKSVKIVYPSN